MSGGPITPSNTQAPAKSKAGQRPRVLCAETILAALHEGKNTKAIALEFRVAALHVKRFIGAHAALQDALRAMQDAAILAAIQQGKTSAAIALQLGLPVRAIRTLIDASEALRRASAAAKDAARAERKQRAAERRKAERQERLTQQQAPRNAEILQGIREGLGQGAIAQRLGVSEQRVRQIVSNNVILSAARDEQRSARSQRRALTRAGQSEVIAQRRAAVAQAKQELDERRVQALMPAIAAGRSLAELGAIVALSSLGVRRFIYGRPGLKQAWLAHAEQGGRFTVRRPRNTPAADARAAQRLLAIVDGIRRGHALETVAAEMDLSPTRTRDLIALDPELRNAWAEARTLRSAVRRKAREDAKTHQASEGGNP